MMRIFITFVLLVASTTTVVLAARNAAPAGSFSRMQTQLFSLNLSTPLSNAPEDKAMQGPAQFMPVVWTGAVLPESTRPDYTVDFPIMLPHKDDDWTGCGGIWHTTNEYNQSFAGAFIILKHSTCADVRYRTATTGGARGVIILNCDTAAPSNCEPYLQQPVFAVRIFNATLISMTFQDGQRIINYLKQKQSESDPLVGPPRETLTMTITSSANIVPEERAALEAITSKTTMTYLYGSPQLDIFPYWNSTMWANTIDPCRNRTAMIWCEGPHVVMINGLYRSWITAKGIPSEFGALTELRYLNVLYNGWLGPLPVSFCNLKKLRVLWLTLQQIAPYITSIPNCDWPDMQDLWVSGNTGIKTLPVSNWTKVQLIRASNLALTSLPSLESLSQLSLLDVSVNKLTALPTMPVTVNGVAPALSIVSAGNNLLTGQLNPDIFRNCTSLSILDLNNNRFASSLPNLEVNTALTYLDLSSQRNLTTNTSGFYGQPPEIWFYQLQKLQQLYLQENALTTPDRDYGYIYTVHAAALTIVDVSNNFLTGPVKYYNYTRDGKGDGADVTPSIVGVGTILRAMVGQSLQILKLGNNKIAGAWGILDASLIRTTKEVYMQNNAISELWSDLWATSIQVFDISNNALVPLAGTVVFKNPVPDGFRLLNLTGNPKLQYAKLPTFAVASPSVKILNGDDFYLCSQVSVTGSTMTFLIDPGFDFYGHCTCQVGKFGKAPLCSSLPDSASLNPYQAISSPDTANFASLVTAAGGLGSQLALGVNNTNAANSSQYQAFSDAMYGDNRLTLGLSTTWFVDLSNMYSDDADLYAANDLPLPDKFQVYRTSDQTQVDAMWTPVRVLTIRLHVSATQFASFDDVINVFEGGADLKGNRVATIRGTDDKSVLMSSNDYTSTPAYQALYGTSIAKISDPRLIEITVFSPTATVQFTSRATGGSHFYATYSYDFTCPTGYFFDRVSDTTAPKCRSDYVLYKVDEGIRSAVYAVSAIALFFILVTIIILFVYWQAGVFKAGSRVFLLLILVLMLVMTLGALLYAAIPDLHSSSGKAVCIGRAWLTALPLAGILAVLLAKNRRLYVIFTTTKLHVEVQTDWDILISVLIVCTLQCVLLAVFSGIPLSKPLMELGKGSISDKLVISCSRETGFMAWIGAEIAFIGTMMLLTAFLGFKTRNLPTQYNESVHLQNALVLLMFFVVIIIPLDVFIQDSPEASILIQGLGQAFLTFVFTAILFGPKIYVAVFPSLSQPTTSLDFQDSSPLQSNGTTAQGTGSNPISPRHGAMTPKKNAYGPGSTGASAPTSSQGLGKARPMPVFTTVATSPRAAAAQQQYQAQTASNHDSSAPMATFNQGQSSGLHNGNGNGSSLHNGGTHDPLPSPTFNGVATPQNAAESPIAGSNGHELHSHRQSTTDENGVELAVILEPENEQ